MRDLLILGTTPHAIEMAELVGRINSTLPAWRLAGFVAHDGSRIGERLADLPVYSYDDALQEFPLAGLAPVYEWPRKDDLPRDRLVSLVDPTSVIAPSARIGLGCVIFPQCYVGGGARIGDFLFCLAGVVINHDDVIQDHVTLTSGVVIAGDVEVEAGCYLGQGCTVRELLTIGRGSLIGMGAVVLHDVAPNSVMIGNPARRLRSRDESNPLVRLLRRARRKLKREAAALVARSRASGAGATGHRTA
jgi:acetyltransferase-like isoleucine patch superfamily enzyme